ncbi:tyrosine-protein kinase Wzc [Filimonas lacunae]|nr:tyrosine-protein kinase Wzc [Filimonas lacunae]
MAGVGLAKKYLKYATPMYESTSKIKLADIHEGVPNSNLFKDFDVFVNTTKISAEVELLKSKVLVRKMLEHLDLRISVYRVGEIHKTELYNQAPFIVQASIDNARWYNRPFAIQIASDSLVTLQAPTGDIFHTTLNHVLSVKGATFLLQRNQVLLQQRPGLPVNDRYECIVHAEDKLVNSVIDGLDIMAVDKDVPVLRISYKSAVPQKSADVVNALAATYIADYIEQKYKSADTTEQFLTKQLDTFSHKLSTSEGDIESYRNRKRIINIRQETETDLRKIADLKKQLASVQMSLNAMDSLNHYISLGKDHFLDLAPNFEAFTDLLSTELVKKIKELQRDKHDLLVKYTPEHEKVKVIDDKLNDIFSYLQESVQNTGRSLHIQYTDLENTINESEKVFIGLPEREKNMTILERNFSMNESIYRFLHGKKTEAEIAKAATLSFHRIISEGEVPEKPVSPNYTIITVLAAILGIAAGVVLIYLVHSLKAKVNNEDTIQRLSATPLSAAVPLCRKAEQRITFFRKWAVELELKKQLLPGTVICISSFKALEGKHYIASALHQAIATLHEKVLLIQAGETVTGMLQNPEGWCRYLREQQLQYDIVIIVNFPVHAHASSLVLMSAATSNLFVLDSRRTPQRCITEADVLKQQLQIPAMQFVLNRAGYTPSLLVQLKNYLLQLVQKIRR